MFHSDLYLLRKVTTILINTTVVPGSLGTTESGLIIITGGLYFQNFPSNDLSFLGASSHYIQLVCNSTVHDL